MPYWGKTETIAEDYGLGDKAVYHPKEKDPICVAISTDGYLVFLHNGELHFAEGVIDLCMQVDKLLLYRKFSRDLVEIWAVFNAYAAKLALEMR